MNKPVSNSVLTKNSKATVNKPTKSPKKCPDNKVLNPKTGRYINKKPLIAIKPYKKGGGRICSQILTPKQVGPICWFMSTFVAMFYSQRSRKILLKASKDWDKNKELFKILDDVLHNKYLKKNKEGEDYNDFNGDVFIDILSYLNIENNKTFPYDPKKVSSGFWPMYYIGKLYKLLNVDYKMFNYCIKNDIISYSYLNEKYDWMIFSIEDDDIKLEMDIDKIMKLKTNEYVEDNIAPPILIIKFDSSNKICPFSNYFKIEGNVKNELKSMKKEITYNEQIYKLDSIILSNYNIIDKSPGHGIAGITCKNKKYIYNSWLRTQFDPTTDKEIKLNFPCELMRYDWDVKNNNFCLDTETCKPISLDVGKDDEILNEAQEIDLCFNFTRGEKILIYVRHGATSENSRESSSPTSNESSSIPDVSLLNIRAGGRCILIKNTKATVNKPTKSPEKCPDNKVLNPKTGRCILIKNKK